jgi:hypothetical protein
MGAVHARCQPVAPGDAVRQLSVHAIPPLARPVRRRRVPVPRAARERAGRAARGDLDRLRPLQRPHPQDPDHRDLVQRQADDRHRLLRERRRPDGHQLSRDLRPGAGTGRPSRGDRRGRRLGARGGGRRGGRGARPRRAPHRPRLAQPLHAGERAAAAGRPALLARTSQRPRAQHRRGDVQREPQAHALSEDPLHRVDQPRDERRPDDHERRARGGRQRLDDGGAALLPRPRSAGDGAPRAGPGPGASRRPRTS